MGDPDWDFQNPANKRRLLGVLQQEIEEMFSLTADPTRWHVPTACPGWEVRDMVGHLVDAAEGFLRGFDLARRGMTDSKAPIGVAGMAEATDEGALAFRAVPRDELIARHRETADRLMREYDSLTDAEWSGLMVPEPHFGPLPAMIIVISALGGYVVHGWDVRQGLGAPHAIAGDAADFLVPFLFLLWSATADTSSVDHPYAIGVRTSGRNGGDTRVEVSNDGLRAAPGSISDCQAIIECDPSTLVLLAYGRVNAGTVRGDRQLVTSFLSLFVSL